MGKIKIVTDSTSDMPADLAQKLNIKVVPLYVNFENESFVDGRDITPKELYKKLRSVKVLPKSAQPSPSDFIEAYKEVLKDCESIISIHISKKMSGTIDSAEMAKKELGADIEIIDSGLVHLPLGIIVLKAAQMAADGKSKNEILDAIQEFKEKIKVLFIPKTLKYLIMGGRIGRAKGLIASILEVNPILTLHLGEVSQFKTTRRWNQAKNELIEAMKSMVKDPKNLTAYITDSDAPEEADEMLQRVKAEIGPREIYRSYIGSTVGIHLGPDSIAVTFFED